MTDVQTIPGVDRVNKFLNDTLDARRKSELCRDFFDHKHYTDAELQVYRQRKQNPVVVNKLRAKIKGLVGLYALRNSDPKAYARTQKHEESSHAITDALNQLDRNSRRGFC